MLNWIRSNKDEAAVEFQSYDNIIRISTRRGSDVFCIIETNATRTLLRTWSRNSLATSGGTGRVQCLLTGHVYAVKIGQHDDPKSSHAVFLREHEYGRLVTEFFDRVATKSSGYDAGENIWTAQVNAPHARDDKDPLGSSAPDAQQTVGRLQSPVPPVEGALTTLFTLYGFEAVCENVCNELNVKTFGDLALLKRQDISDLPMYIKTELKLANIRKLWRMIQRVQHTGKLVPPAPPVEKALTALFKKHKLEEVCEEVCDELGVKTLGHLAVLQKEDIYDLPKYIQDGLKAIKMHKLGAMIESVQRPPTTPESHTLPHLPHRHHQPPSADGPSSSMAWELPNELPHELPNRPVWLW